MPWQTLCMLIMISLRLLYIIRRSNCSMARFRVFSSFFKFRVKIGEKKKILLKNVYSKPDLERKHTLFSSEPITVEFGFVFLKVFFFWWKTKSTPFSLQPKIKIEIHRVYVEMWELNSNKQIELKVGKCLPTQTNARLE